jgi:hypothetical protein
MHRIIIATLAFACVSALVPAVARDNGQWEDQSAAVRQWFRTLMQPDHPRVSCCGEADAYEADSFEVEGDHYVAIITAHRAVTAIPVGTRIPVPNYKMKYDAGNPTGHGIIFIGTQGFCYVTPGGI